MKDWITDALSGPAGFERQFKEYVGLDEYQSIEGTALAVIRKEEFQAFIDYCKKSGR